MSFALRSSARPVVAARPAVRAARPAAARSLRTVAVRAGIRAYPDPDFVAETLEAFPDKMIADVEEARVSLFFVWRWEKRARGVIGRGARTAAGQEKRRRKHSSAGRART